MDNQNQDPQVQQPENQLSNSSVNTSVPNSQALSDSGILLNGRSAVKVTLNLNSQSLKITNDKTGETMYDLALTSIKSVKKSIIYGAIRIKSDDSRLAVYLTSSMLMVLPLPMPFINSAKAKIWANAINQYKNSQQATIDQSIQAG